MLPLVQIPPRGLWKRSGGVVYATAESWLGAELSPTPDAAGMVRRYLRAFGPATAADVTAWSGITGVRDVLGGMPDLVTYPREAGRAVHDLEGLELAAADLPAPVRLLGEYDNLWLAHADRNRVTSPGGRARWMGPNGGIGKTVFVDGHLEGLWRATDGRVDVELFRRLTRSEREELDAEVSGMEEFLAR